MNAIFGSIPILSKKISNIKKGQPIPVHQFSGLVTQNFKSLNFIICFKKIFTVTNFILGNNAELNKGVKSNYFVEDLIIFNRIFYYLILINICHSIP